jgi:hypothetical protein
MSLAHRVDRAEAQRMDHLELLLTAGGGAFSSRQAGRLGVGRDAVSRWCRAGEIVRVRRGAFVDRATFARAGPEDPYRLRVRAVMVGRAADSMASDHAALVLHGLPLWDLGLGRIDIAAPVSGDFKRAGVGAPLVRSASSSDRRTAVRHRGPGAGQGRLS